MTSAVTPWRRARLALALLAPACSPDVTRIGQWSPEPESLYLEAESGVLSGGFSKELDGSASGGQFIAPPATLSDSVPGDARAVYSFATTVDDVFRIWGRVRNPTTESNRFWVQVDGGDWHKWRITVGDVWYWDDVHENADYGTTIEFQLRAGAHELRLANCVPSAALDRLYLTASAESPEKNVRRCNPPHSIEREGVCLPSCGSQSGTQCGVAECSSKQILEAYDCDVCCRDAP